MAACICIYVEQVDRERMTERPGASLEKHTRRSQGERRGMVRKLTLPCPVENCHRDTSTDTRLVIDGDLVTFIDGDLSLTCDQVPSTFHVL